MATRIVFAGNESIMVAEELDAVVQALEGHAPDTPSLPCFSRKAQYGEAVTDGAPVHVRPAAILYVTSA